MQTLALSTITALLGGMLTYGLLRWLLWDIDMRALGPIVGLGAVAGGAFGLWWTHHRGGDDGEHHGGR